MQITSRSQLHPGRVGYCKREDIPTVFRIGDTLTSGPYWKTVEDHPSPPNLGEGTLYTVINPTVNGVHLSMSCVLADSVAQFWFKIKSLVPTSEPVLGSISTPVPGATPMYTTVVTAYVTIPATKDTPATTRVLIPGEVRTSPSPLVRNDLIIEAGALLQKGEEAKNMGVQTYQFPMCPI